MLSKQEIRQLQEKEWNEELAKSLQELMKNRFNLRSGHTKDSHMVRQLRKYIATLKTIKKEQEMAGGMKAPVKTEATVSTETAKKKTVKALKTTTKAPKKVKASTSK